MGRHVCIGEIGVVFRVPRVELENQPTGTRDPIVHVAMLVFLKRICSNQFGVPAATPVTLRTATRGWTSTVDRCTGTL